MDQTSFRKKRSDNTKVLLCAARNSESNGDKSVENRTREFGEANAVEMPGLKFGGVDVSGVQLGDISLNLDGDAERQESLENL